MASAPKTAPTGASVKAFVDAIEDDRRRKDVRAVMKIMRAVTGERPKMWGDSIIGYGSYHYVYASGREGDWPLTGLSPRKRNLSVYVMSGFEHEPELMAALGKYKTGKSCLYVDTLADVDVDVLTELVRRSVAHMREAYPS